MPGYIVGMATAPYPLVGTLLCLDLVNTEPQRDGGRVDLIRDADGLLGWLRATGTAADDAARRALARAGPGELERLVREARTLRAAVRLGVERMVAGRAPGASMVRAVNRVLASRPAVAKVVRRDGRLVTRMEPVGAAVLQALAPVAASAAWLLEHGDPALVRRCAGHDCVLFFYDGTKNRSRRWCSMDACGSRAKAGAYYRRRRSAT